MRTMAWPGKGKWTTHAIIAIALSVLLPFLGLSGVASAQSAISIQGTVDAVDCQAQTVVVDTANGQQTFAASDDAFTNVDATNLPFCSLEGYAGAPATVWLAPSGDQLVVTEVNVTGPVATAPATTEVVSPLPIWGTVLGTVVAAGLLYLMVHGPDGYYYRYPYYGGYYRHYYNSGYRPYTGAYPASAPIITVAWPILGVVLGTVIVNGDPFIVSRDSGGHSYRYPYYGPYRQYYYRPAYRPYTAANANVYMQATVRQGDSHWDAPAHAMAQQYGTQAVRSVPRYQPQAGTHQLTGTPSRQPQVGTRQAQPAPRQPQQQPLVIRQPQPALRQPQQQPLVIRQPQPPTRQPQQPQLVIRQPQPPTRQPQQPQPATRRPAGTSQNQQCGGPSKPPCSNQGR